MSVSFPATTTLTPTTTPSPPTTSVLTTTACANIEGMTDKNTYIDKNGIVVIITNPDGSTDRRSVQSLESDIFIEAGDKLQAVRVEVPVNPADRIDIVNILPVENVASYTVSTIKIGDVTEQPFGLLVS